MESLVLFHERALAGGRVVRVSREDRGETAGLLDEGRMRGLRKGKKYEAGRGVPSLNSHAPNEERADRPGAVRPWQDGCIRSLQVSRPPVSGASAALQRSARWPGRGFSMRLPHWWHGPTSNAAQAPGRQQGVAHRIRRHLFRPLLELDPCCDPVDQMEPPHDGRWAIAEKSPFGWMSRWPNCLPSPVPMLADWAAFLVWLGCLAGLSSPACSNAAEHSSRSSNRLANDGPELPSPVHSRTGVAAVSTHLRQLRLHLAHVKKPTPTTRTGRRRLGAWQRLHHSNF